MAERFRLMSDPGDGVARSILDAHVHIHGSYTNPSMLLEDLNSYGIQRAIVFASPINGSGAASMPLWYGRTIGRSAIVQLGVRLAAGSRLLNRRERPNNDDVLRVVSRCQDRLDWLYFANPYLPDAQSELIRAVDRNGAIGLKVHLWVYPISLLDARVTDLLTVIQIRGLIALIDLGAQPEAFRSIEVLADQFSAVTFIIPHLPPPLERVLEIAERHQNIYLDTSSPQVTPKHVYQALSRIGPLRILYGSDAPREMGGDMRYSLSVIDTLTVDDETKGDLLCNNAMSLISRCKRS
jgi:predicted TIM-barrel fold metal-dependent hydrolase